MKNTLKNFKNDFKIIKSHKLANGFISITYVGLYNSTTCTPPKTIQIENLGGALKSLFHYITGK